MQYQGPDVSRGYSLKTLAVYYVGFCTGRKGYNVFRRETRLYESNSGWF